MTDTEGYKGHRAGSAKEKVHKVYDEKGQEAAIKKAVALDKKETTARTWISSWKTGRKAVKADKAVKKTAKKAAPKKTAKKAAPKKTAKKAAPAKRERIAEASAAA